MGTEVEPLDDEEHLVASGAVGKWYRAWRCPGDQDLGAP